MQRELDPRASLSDQINHGGFLSFVQKHLSGNFFERGVGDRGKGYLEPLLLAISFLDTDGGAAREYFVTKSGHISTCCEVYFLATQGGEHRQLTAEQLATLKNEIAKLPTTNAYPPLNQLVLISFSDGDSWVTRACQADKIRSLRAFLEDRFPGVFLPSP
jgi:hypothetical protein